VTMECDRVAPEHQERRPSVGKRDEQVPKIVRQICQILHDRPARLEPA